MGWIRLTLQGSMMTSSLITPTVLVNGWRIAAQYGENVIPVHPGPNRVEVSCQWLMKFGQAALDTHVPPGGQVLVYYAAPMHQFTRGAIGFEKQKRPGMLGFGLLMAALLLVVLAFVVLASL